MKVTYWVAECLDDSKVFNVRARTKREAKMWKDEVESTGAKMGPVHKVVLQYFNAFQLVQALLGEDRGIELMLSGELTT